MSDKKQPPELITIPYVDVRQSGLTDLLKTQKENNDVIEKLKENMNIVLRSGAMAALSLGDHFAKQWLKKTNNPYFDEITEFQKSLKTKGVYALNLSYEWACTTGVF